MSKGRLLVIDDEITVCQAYADALTSHDYEVDTAFTIADGMKKATGATFDLVLLDKRLPDGNGLEILPELKQLSPAPEVIMITAYASVKDGVEAIKAGAFDYLIKPIDLSELKHKVNVAMERQQLRRRVDALEEELSGSRRQFGIVGDSPAIRELISRIERLGSVDCNILILGETGTGKELVAQALHKVADPEGTRAFVALNCAALPETIVERELFGHEAGAYTGAAHTKPGYFETADGGSLFLDEVTELSLTIQAKLLRVIERGEFYPLGSATPTRVSVRLISATNDDPNSLTARGKFREDLLYRLSVVRIQVPPLRQRREDIPLLTQHFIRDCNRRYDRQIDGCDKDAMIRLQSFDWPGNVRELQHALEHACVLCRGSTIKPDDLPPYLSELSVLPQEEQLPTEYADLSFKEAKRRSVAAFTRSIVAYHLEEADGNVTEASNRLGIQRTALQRLMRKFKISR